MNMFLVFALTEVKQSLKLQRTKVILFVALFLSASFYVLVELPASLIIKFHSRIRNGKRSAFLSKSL